MSDLRQALLFFLPQVAVLLAYFLINRSGRRDLARMHSGLSVGPREACAQVCDAIATFHDENPSETPRGEVARQCADAIRANGKAADR